MDRERKVNVETLTSEQLSVMTVEIAKKINNITNEALDKVNTILKIYGLTAEMHIKINKLDKE